ncbi:hypothetical protein ACLBOM_32025 [Escherichia coli]
MFGEYLRAENVLQNYDEFATLKALQQIDSQPFCCSRKIQSRTLCG